LVRNQPTEVPQFHLIFFSRLVKQLHISFVEDATWRNLRLRFPSVLPGRVSQSMPCISAEVFYRRTIPWDRSETRTQPPQTQRELLPACGAKSPALARRGETINGLYLSIMRVASDFFPRFRKRDLNSFCASSYTPTSYYCSWTKQPHPTVREKDTQTAPQPWSLGVDLFCQVVRSPLLCGMRQNCEDGLRAKAVRRRTSRMYFHWQFFLVLRCSRLFVGNVRSFLCWRKQSLCAQLPRTPPPPMFHLIGDVEKVFRILDNTSINTCCFRDTANVWTLSMRIWVVNFLEAIVCWRVDCLGKPCPRMWGV